MSHGTATQRQRGWMRRMDQMCHDNYNRFRAAPAEVGRHEEAMNAQNSIGPDAVVRVRLFAADEGGRESAIPPVRYRCPVFFGDERKQANDCAFFFDQLGKAVEPGGPSQIVAITFLRPDLIADKLQPGARFVLWEGRDIGEAEVIEVSATQ